ncbi:hypothetical protein ACWD3I_21370 [Streptomyces sp. NPDC002817]|uniref:hypothetical protein n=1 Tax=Streptomyces sp. NPDC088357 TaxID=3154655 RepID=UPI00342C6BEF
MVAGVVIAWAVLAVVGGGLTWWLQDSEEPPKPVGRGEFSPQPSLPEDRKERCGLATPSPPEEDGAGTEVLCVVMTP